MLVPSKIKKLVMNLGSFIVLVIALENRINILTVNTFLLPEFPGRSFAIDFDIIEDVVIPKISVLAEEKEDVIIVDVEPKKIEKFRNERLSNRRPEIYIDILKKENY